MAAAHIENHIMAITRPILHTFAPNLKWRLKMGPADSFTVKIHIVLKSKMAAAAILKSVKRQ